MEHRDVRVVLETARHRLEGTLLLPRGGFRSRLTDYLNADEKTFLALTDVVLRPLDGGGTAQRHPYVAVSRDHVVLALEPDDPAD